MCAIFKQNTLDIQVFEVFLDMLLVLMSSSPAWQPSRCGSRHLTPHSGEKKKNAEGRELGKSRRRKGEKGRMEKAQNKVS